MISPGPADSAGTRSSASVMKSSPSWPLSHGAVGAAPADALALGDRAVAHAADRQAPEVRGGVEVRDHRLQRMVGLVARRRDVLEQQVEERLEAVARHRRVEARPAALGVRVDDGEAELVLVGVEVEEQVLDHAQHLADPGVRAVDLVDVEDHRQAALERLAQDEARLRQRALGGVDEQEDGVDHRRGCARPRRRSRRGPGVSTMLIFTPL